jgi:hypothetical protein
MKEIKLTKGYRTLVDDINYEWLNSYNWHAQTTPNGSIYAARNASIKLGEITSKEKPRVILMHQQILDFPEIDVDHYDRDTLNNQRFNLRSCTESQNGANAKLSKRNKSGFKGVWKHRSGKWQAQICINRKKINLGLFKDIDIAAEAYKRAAKKYFGNFSRIE